MAEVKELIQKYLPQVLEHRRHIHAHPELTGQEKETAAYIAQVLRDMGLKPVENVGGYGVVALIAGGHRRPAPDRVHGAPLRVPEPGRGPLLRPRHPRGHAAGRGLRAQRA